MKMRQINVAEIDLDVLAARAVEFHGHLGPYLVCGVKMGLLALRLLGSHGYTELTVTAETGVTPPVSCLVDGLQIATGCTLGKGNISVLGGGHPRALFRAKDKSVAIELRPGWPEKFAQMDGEVAAQMVQCTPEEELFTWRLLPSS
ncbi:MAG: formylmethanofuran dehydrogenase subunit E family protein [Candidatus Bipolaricaulota bacterium]|nr:formylmethanofuran dehydrogenase subunit E family protein [Candidatus Bipolaricaulota bacterium]